MIRNIVYAVFGVGSLGLMLAAAPAGKVLTGKPETGKVTKGAKGKGKSTVRGGPAFIWLGGGYKGGK